MAGTVRAEGAGTGEWVRVECPRCRAPLDLLQPNERDPADLEGCCLACGRRYHVSGSTWTVEGDIPRPGRRRTG
jgi:uncharacterized protein YbaR (Trm112 family)